MGFSISEHPATVLRKCHWKKNFSEKCRIHPWGWNHPILRYIKSFL